MTLSNNIGQLGDGTLMDRKAPAQIGSGFTALSGGGGATAYRSHSVALKVDGTVWTWGSNAYGQLGTGDTVDRAGRPAPG